ncbi:MAG: PQQ-binding-like beta-propeller repeat protein, partial [Oceanidesulfovibrio sp.]
LWTADCHHADLLPSQVQQKVAQALKTHNIYMTKFDQLKSRYKKAQKGLPGTADKLNAIKAECEEFGLVGVCGATSDGKLDGRARSVHLAWDQGKYDPPKIKEIREFLKQYSYNWFVDPWILCGHGAIGYAPCTPCSDGERVYVATAFYDLFCYDMDGQVVWKRYIPEEELNESGNFRGSFFPSPMLYDDLLIRYWANDSVRQGGMSVRAYNKLTGEEVWRAGKGEVTPYALGTPQRMEIDGVKLLYLSDGRVLRLADGKQVATGMGYAAHGKPDVVHGNLVFASTGQEGGGYNGEKVRDLPRGYVLAYRLTWKGDSHEELKVEELWRQKLSCRTIFYKNRLISVGVKQGLRILEPLTGKVVHKTGSRQYVKELGTNFHMKTNHYLTLAGNHLFLSQRGVHSVVTLNGKYVSRVDDIPIHRGNCYKKRDKYEFRPQYGGQMFHSGNRSFYIQNMIHPKLVCIGDPSQKARMSEAHQ